jgi:endoribonuclease Dicer
MAVKAVTIFVNSPNHTATSWKDYLAAYSLPSYQSKQADGAEENLAGQVERLGYKFKYPRLLHSAFTHPSYPSTWAKVPCYQRLEFLGDALLDMVCVEHLFHRFPDRDPQWLTEHKVSTSQMYRRLANPQWMAMVSNKFLGALAVKLSLHIHLQHFSNPLIKQITHYAEELQAAESESKGEVDYWLETADSPKVSSSYIYLGIVLRLTQRQSSVFLTWSKLISELYSWILALILRSLRLSLKNTSCHSSMTCLFTTHLPTGIPR